MNRSVFRSTAIRWLCVSIIVAVPCALRAEDEKKTPSAAEQVVRLTIRGEVNEIAEPFAIFGGPGGSTLREIQQAIRKAASDGATKALVLRLESPALGWTQLQALRRELLEFRKSGKPSYCHVTDADNTTYILASACGEVSILPTGALYLPGVGMYRVYLGELFRKIGIEFQELRMGRYKSAAEALTRNEPSEAVREESHAIVDRLFDEYLESIAENRSLEPLVVRGLVDRALLSPGEAMEAGLVDHIEYPDEFLERVEEGGRKIVDARPGKRLELKTGGFAGFMTILNEIFGGPKAAFQSKKPKVAIVHGVGAIIEGDGHRRLFGGELMTSKTMVKLFRELRDDDTVKAIVFRVDSPGGSAIASELIWRAVQQTARKKPVVVSMGDLAASGGYYVSCSANWIVAERGTLTGSIGVIGAVPDTRKLHETLGISYSAFTRGKRHEMISPYGELTDDGRELLLGYMKRIYKDFIARVAEGRSLAEDAVAPIAEGRVWTGGQALEHGLVDEIGGLETALAKARELSGVGDDAEIITRPRPKTFFEILADSETGGMKAWPLRAVVSGLPDDLKALLRRVEWLRSARKEKVLAALPEVITVR